MLVLNSREVLRARLLLNGGLLPGDYGQVASDRTAPQYDTSRRRSSLVRRAAYVMVGSALSIVLYSLIPLLGASLALALEWALLRVSQRRRAEEFERDYPALLLALASAVRTGLDPLVALNSTGQLFHADSSMRAEIARVNSCLERGCTEEEAIHQFGTGMSHPDVQLFRAAFLIARREGSSLSECLRRLVRVTRNRQSFRRKLRASIAMQRLSALGIGGCAVAIGTIQAVSNPTAITLALESPAGARILAGGALCIVVGIVWMARLARSYR